MNSKKKVADYDVVVVGAGNSALVSALAAREAGAKVLVLEAAPKIRRGGNTYFTGGGFRFVIGGLDEVREISPDVSDAEAAKMDMPGYSQDQFYSGMMRQTQNCADPEMTRTLVTQSNQAIRWMVGQGVRLEPYFVNAIRVGDRLKWLPNDILMGAKGAGAGLSEMLFEITEKKGIEIRYETRATGLLQNAKGKVCGVSARDNGGNYEIGSRGVILACGGFEANREMRARYLGPKWEMARIRGSRCNMGDGIRMAMEIGAQPTGHWSKCHGTLVDADAPMFADRATGDKTSRQSYPYGILVNSIGKRFIDEGEDTRQFTYAKCGEAAVNQPQGVAFQIFDAKVKHLMEHRYVTATPTEANTIEELAELLDIDADGLKETVESFNAAVQPGNFNPAGKDGKRTQGIEPPKSNWAQKIDTPPFVGYAVTGGITFTFGGLKINCQAQVLDYDDRVIPGLYAVGEMAAGLFYHNYAGGSCLTAGAVFGRMAGAGAAAEPAAE